MLGYNVVSVAVLRPACCPIAWATGEGRDSITTPVVPSIVIPFCSYIITVADTVEVRLYTICLTTDIASASGDLAFRAVFCPYAIMLSN